MLYQTLLRLDSSHHISPKMTTEAYVGHCAVMEGFKTLVSPTEKNVRSKLDILYAVNNHPSGEIRVLVQSREPGTWTDCSLSDALLDNPEVKQVSIPKEGKIAYRLRYNPVKKMKGKVISAASEPNDALAWFTRRANKNGLELSTEPRLIDLSRVNNDRKNFNIVTAEVTGMAHISDVDKFSSLVESGIGGCRAYGCGLMLVRSL